MSSIIKRMMNKKPQNNFTNCKLGNAHQLVYCKGFGYRCKICGKIKTDCTGWMTTVLTKEQSQ